MTCYLYSNSGGVIGYLDARGKNLYSTSGPALAYFDSKRKYLYEFSDGSAYGYVGGSEAKYVYEMSGGTIGYFQLGPNASFCMICELKSVNKYYRRLSRRDAKSPKLDQRCTRGNRTARWPSILADLHTI